ncbi:hypothetical protein GWI33_001033 [Rhynchophorus ferrugineus]|uniref:Uncharacterized protein n=1 Tax=Rhynchophorus ferrugineus TaxID=354439 RepID=A0A834ISZ2_RHYFE|nr:hypothetical protein GWI33_001033 [Rhynchophorus ferrugineus]
MLALPPPQNINMHSATGSSFRNFLTTIDRFLHALASRRNLSPADFPLIKVDNKFEVPHLNPAGLKRRRGCTPVCRFSKTRPVSPHKMVINCEFPELSKNRF